MHMMVFVHILQNAQDLHELLWWGRRVLSRHFKCCLYAAIEIAKELGSGKKVLALAQIMRERYLSTSLYEFE